MRRATSILPDVSGVGRLCGAKKEKPRRKPDRRCVNRIACPTCHVPVGEKCVTSSGLIMSEVHLAREAGVDTADVHNRLQDILRLAEARLQEAP